MAPEVIENKQYTLKADVFSYGVSIDLLRLLSGKYVQGRLHMVI
jgi:hypothetical protein